MKCGSLWFWIMDVAVNLLLLYVIFFGVATDIIDMVHLHDPFSIATNMIHLGIAYLVFCCKLFIESVLKYTCTLTKFEKVRKCEKKWGFIKLYIKTKNKLKVKSCSYRPMPNRPVQACLRNCLYELLIVFLKASVWKIRSLNFDSCSTPPPFLTF